MGKVPALKGFGRLNPAPLSGQENTRPVRLIDQGQGLPVPGQPGVGLDKFKYIHFQAVSNGIRFFRLKPYVSVFPAAGLALDALEVFQIYVFFFCHCLIVFRPHPAEFVSQKYFGAD